MTTAQSVDFAPPAPLRPLRDPHGWFRDSHDNHAEPPPCPPAAVGGGLPGTRVPLPSRARRPLRGEPFLNPDRPSTGQPAAQTYNAPTPQDHRRR